MIETREVINGWAQKYGWEIDPFILPSGSLMTTYKKGFREVQVWTNTYGSVTRADLAENGWQIENLRIEFQSVTEHILRWMQAPVEQLSAAEEETA